MEQRFEFTISKKHLSRIITHFILKTELEMYASFKSIKLKILNY